MKKLICLTASVMLLVSWSATASAQHPRTVKKPVPSYLDAHK